MLLADALSHLPSRTNTEIKLDLWVDAISIYTFSQRCLTKVAAEMQWDPILSTVHRLTLNGWPDRQGHVPRAVRFYWSFWDELSIDGDLLTKGERVVVPLSCRDSIMVRPPWKPCRHQQGNGPGQNLCLLARHGSRCHRLHQVVLNMYRETLHPHEVPPRPCC